MPPKGSRINITRQVHYLKFFKKLKIILPLFFLWPCKFSFFLWVKKSFPIENEGDYQRCMVGNSKTGVFFLIMISALNKDIF